MRLLFVADGRSPTALSWLQYWIERGDEVHLVSTFPCDPPAGLTSFHIFPVAFASWSGRTKQAGALPAGTFRQRFRGLFLRVRYWLGPLSLGRDRRRFRALVEALSPDLVHALRIPFEGMLAVVTPPHTPLVVSIWGNDLILHARGSPLMGWMTRRTLKRANGLLAEAARDLRMPVRSTSALKCVCRHRQGPRRNRRN